MMKTLQFHVIGLRVLPVAVLAVTTSITAYAPTATAGHGAAWGIGGLLAGSMLTKKKMDEQALAYNTGQRQGAYAAPQVQYAAPRPAAAPPTTMTPEQKLDQLNKLAAGGYITPQEYKAKKQAILDSL